MGVAPVAQVHRPIPFGRRSGKVCEQAAVYPEAASQRYEPNHSCIDAPSSHSMDCTRCGFHRFGPEDEQICRTWQWGSSAGRNSPPTKPHARHEPGLTLTTAGRDWLFPGRLCGSERSQNFLKKFAIGPCVGGGLIGSGGNLDTLDHDRPSEPGGFQFCKDRFEIHLARSELRHHLALWSGAILGAEAGDVARDRCQLGGRVFAGVVDNIPGVVPDFEIWMSNLVEATENLLRSAAAAAMRFEDNLEPVFLC